jgi:hypothetical protein
MKPGADDDTLTLFRASEHHETVKEVSPVFSPAARLVQRVFCTVHKISLLLVGTELPAVKAKVDQPRMAQTGVQLPSRGDPVSCRLPLAVSAVSSFVPV